MTRVTTESGYSGADGNGRINHEGILWSDLRRKLTDTYEEDSNTSYGTPVYDRLREPGILIDKDANTNFLKRISDILSDQTNKYSSSNAFLATMQEDYNEMVESVKKYSGFYISRYEIGVENGRPISKAGVDIATAIESGPTGSWYGLYAMSKKYKGSNNLVKSTMIWGSQWDAMVSWLINNGCSFSPYSLNRTGKTGGNSYNKTNNVYDLHGSHYQWTMEANGRNKRSARAGEDITASLGDRNRRYTWETNVYAEACSTHFTLYFN